MSEGKTRIRYRGTGFYVSVAVAILVTAALLVFAVQNTATVDVQWLGFELSGPLFAFVLGAALSAVVLDEVVGLIWRSIRRSRLNRQQRLTEKARLQDTTADNGQGTQPGEDRRSDDFEHIAG